MPKRKKGEGSVFLSRGRWVARTPRPERKAFYGSTAREAMRKRDKHMRRRGSHAFGRGTVGAFLGAWLESKRAALKPRTWEGYRADLDHAEPLSRVALQALKPAQIQSVVNDVARVSPGVANKLHARLVQAFDYAVETEQIDRNPARKVIAPPKPKSGARPYSPDETRAWLAAIRGHRFEALFRLMTVEGLRRGEALALYWRHVGDDSVTIRQTLQRYGGELHVTAAKTTAGNRTVPLSSRTAEAIRHWRIEQKRLRLKAGRAWAGTEFVFTARHGTPLEPRNVNRMLGRLVAKAKLPARRLHDHRHTALTNLVSRGVDIKTVQQVAGHASLASTLPYLHMVPGGADRVRAAMDDGDHKL